jgi:hypothetical protein
VAQEGAPAAQVVRPVPYYDTNTDQTIRNRNFLPNPSAPVPPETRFVYHNVEDALAKVSGSLQFSDSVRAILSQKMLCDLSSSLNYHFLTQTGLAFGFTGLSPNNVVFTLTRLTEHHDQGQPEPEFLEYKLKIVNSLSQSPWMGNLYDDQIFEGQLEGRINLLLTHQTRTDKVRAKVIEANLAYNINRIFTQGV